MINSKLSVFIVTLILTISAIDTVSSQEFLASNINEHQPISKVDALRVYNDGEYLYVNNLTSEISEITLLNSSGRKLVTVRHMGLRDLLNNGLWIPNLPNDISIIIMVTHSDMRLIRKIEI